MGNGPNTFDWQGIRRDSCLAEKVVLFSRFLKSRGFKIFSSNIIDALRSMEEIDISDRESFFHALRTNMVTTDMEWAFFGRLFEDFWRELDQDEEDEARGAPPQQMACEGDSVLEMIQDITLDQDSNRQDTSEKERLEGVCYSPAPRLERKSFAKIQKGDIQTAQLTLKNMISRFRIAQTRRYRRSRNPGRIDFRLTLRKSLKTGGIPLELFYKKRKKRLKRLVVLADVSGSMDRYARFVMPFILGLKGIGSRAEVFVFSTSLTPITYIIRHMSLDKALERISREVPDWSGGTRIGYSLHQFQEGHGERLLSKRTVVVIMSDGWDLGGRELLRREMETLSQKASCILWLNPLAGDAEYSPICRGMQAALPYVDYFLPADSLQSLKRVGRTLSRVMAH